MDKSAHIRQILAEQPDMSPKEIQVELSRRGIEVSRNLCKVVRHRELHGKNPKRRSADRKSTPTLRFGERQTSRRIIVRLSREDLEVWGHLKAYAESIVNPSSELYYRHGWNFEDLPEVQRWLEAVSTMQAKRRRQEIFEEFIEDLRGLYPPPHSYEITRRGTPWIKTELPPHSPSFALARDKSTMQVPQNWDRELCHQAEAEEQAEIRGNVETFVDRHRRMLDLFFDTEVLDYLLSLEAWYRYQALNRITNSYSIISALDDILELAWSTMKPIDLPRMLKDLFSSNTENSSESDGEWRNHPWISQLFFLLSLWIAERIKISCSDENGISCIMIGKLHT